MASTVAKDFYLTLPKGDYAKVKASMTSQQPLIAPIKAGQVVGKITFTLDGKIINEQNNWRQKQLNKLVSLAESWIAFV